MKHNALASGQNDFSNAFEQSRSRLVPKIGLD